MLHIPGKAPIKCESCVSIFFYLLSSPVGPIEVWVVNDNELDRLPTMILGENFIRKALDRDYDDEDHVSR